MPILFVGHGSPMNAIEENEFSRGWRTVGEALPRPEAILCISAHWETRGPRVTAMAWPKTIHDFGGFPEELYKVAYPAPGNPQTAAEIRNVAMSEIGLDERWGLDHGCWSVLRHLFPLADVPVLQLSLDRQRSPREHLELARELAPLRKKGILIVGSGNIVHNLGMIDWQNENGGYTWALEADRAVKRLVEAGHHKSLADYPSLGREVAMGIPTPEHFLPLLYPVALRQPAEAISFFNERTVYGSISMTSFRIG